MKTRLGFGIVGPLLLAVVTGCTTVLDEVATPAPLPMPSSMPASQITDALDLAERALYEGRIGDAKALLNRVEFSAGKSPRTRLIAAEVQLASGEYRPAASAFRELISESDVRAVASQGEGIALVLADGSSDSGHDILHAAVAQDPSLSRAWNALGYIHDSRREWRQASTSYARALAADPKSAMIFNNRGYSMLMQGRIEEALTDLGQALRLDPNLRPARENFRLALAWDGQYTLALAGAEGGDKARALNNVGYVAMLRGDNDDAEAFLLRAIEVDPTFNAIAARNLEQLRRRRGPTSPGGAPRPQ